MKTDAKSLVMGLMIAGVSIAQAAPMNTNSRPAARPVVPSVQQIHPTVVDSPGGSSDGASSGEDFKGKPSGAEFTFGGLAGLGVVDSSGGFAIIGNAAKKIVHHGFIPDINNQVFIEVEAGPMFTSGTTVFVYGTHLRWDFEQNSTWTFYALGGVGGNITSATLGSRWEFFPRFGAGAFVNVSPMLTLRGELSHELMAVGVSFAI